MSNDSQATSLSDAASHFLARLPAEERGINRQEIYKFIRWFGGERTFAGLTAAEVANYAERLSTSDTDYMKKLGLLRAFLVSAKKERWSKTNLAVHLRAKKRKIGPHSSARQDSPEAALLSRQGYAELEAELMALKDKRSEAIEAIRRAAADKDFRENAPLEAAREQRGLLEGRITELEAVLRSAAIIDENQESVPKAGIGYSVVLRDLDSGQELRYTLVDSREVDPVKGKISSVSPIGKAVIGRGQGETVEITVPAGKLRYQIEQLEHGKA